MFEVQDVLLSDDVPQAKFACDIHVCKGACCVVGSAGAPVTANELPVLQKAYKQLKNGLRKEARKAVNDRGLVLRSRYGGYELNCVDDQECVFVTFDDQGIATCAIQRAYERGEFSWPKPISCHLFPLRITEIGNRDFVNYEFIEAICSPACDRAEHEGIWLSDFLKDALTRRYGEDWYEEFSEICADLRKQQGEAA